MSGYLIVLRDPDASNSFESFGCNPMIIDVDLGRMDLHEPLEWADWIAGHADQLKTVVDPAARDHYREVLADVAERYGQTIDPWIPPASRCSCSPSHVDPFCIEHGDPI